MVNVISDSSLLEISIVDKGASGDGEDRPRIVIAKRESPMNLEEALAMLPEEAQTVVMDALAAAAAPAEPAPEPAPAEPMAEPAPEMPEKMEHEEEPKAEMPAEKMEGEDEDEEKPVAVAKALEVVSAEDRNMVLEAIEKRDILEKRVAELEGEKDRAKFQTIAKSMDALPGMTTDSRAELLQTIAKSLDAEIYAKVEKQWKDAADTIAKSLNEVGSAATVPGTPTEKLQAIAKSIREANPALSADGAMGEAMKQNPDLYKEARGA